MSASDKEKVALILRTTMDMWAEEPGIALVACQREPGMLHLEIRGSDHRDQILASCTIARFRWKRLLYAMELRDLADKLDANNYADDCHLESDLVRKALREKQEQLEGVIAERDAVLRELNVLRAERLRGGA